MAKLIKIAETKDLMPGQGGVFNVDGEQVVVFNIDGRFVAVEDRFSKHATLEEPARYYTVKTSGNDIQVEL